MKHQRQRTKRSVGTRPRSRGPGKNRNLAPRTAEEYFALPQKDRELWKGVTQVPSKMRADRVSLSEASRQVGIDSRTEIRLARSAFRKLKNGRYVAKANDHLLRVLPIPTHRGLQEIGIPDFRQASLLGEYWNIVQHYLETGDDSYLKKFSGKYVTDANGERFDLLTDTEELDRLGSAGELSFESFYARAA